MFRWFNFLSRVENKASFKLDQDQVVYSPLPQGACLVESKIGNIDFLPFSSNSSFSLLGEGAVILPPIMEVRPFFTKHLQTKWQMVHVVIVRLYNFNFSGGAWRPDGHCQPQCGGHQDQEGAGESQLLWLWCKEHIVHFIIKSLLVLSSHLFSGWLWLWLSQEELIKLWIHWQWKSHDSVQAPGSVNQ